MDCILIPVKRLDSAKARLAGVLSREDRRRLGLSMLADVLRATEKWSSRFIVTSDRDAEAVGMAFGCEFIADHAAGLNESLSQATSLVVSMGAEAVLVLPGDVPLVSSYDVELLFAADADVVIVASRDGGTNALLRRPPEVIEPLFGPGSAAVHVGAATRSGRRVVELKLDSLALDIDRPSDLADLGNHPVDRESVMLARRLSLGIEGKKASPAREGEGP